MATSAFCGDIDLVLHLRVRTGKLQIVNDNMFFFEHLKHERSKTLWRMG